MDVRMTTAPSLVLACVFYANDTGVGIVSACLHPGFVRTSSVIGGKTPHFLLLFLASGVWRDKTYNNVKRNYKNGNDAIQWGISSSLIFSLLYQLLKPTGLMWQQGIRFIMKQLLTTIIISLSLVITGITVYASNTSSASYNHELISTSDNVDQYLGQVNTCNPDGTTCNIWHAFRDSDNGRIYLVMTIRVDEDGNTIPGSNAIIYAQESNDSRWKYMIRNCSTWEYFSL